MQTHYYGQLFASANLQLGHCKHKEWDDCNGISFIKNDADCVPRFADVNADQLIKVAAVSIRIFSIFKSLAVVFL